MPATLLTDAAWLVPAVALTAAAISSITRSLVSLGEKMVEERSRTARFNTALKDSTPPQRAEIIFAYGSLERGRASELTTREPEEVPPPSLDRSSLVARPLRNGPKEEPGKE
ncbi:MAG: hypothetical protein JO272_11330 [Pseudonocardiales bacterium]|nr:hypothetical protein [Pseudonocardiales bacterium]